MRSSALLLLLLPACSPGVQLVTPGDSGPALGDDTGQDSGGADDTAPPDDTGEPDDTSPPDDTGEVDDGVLDLTDEANLRINAALVVPSAEVYASEDTLFDWSRLAKDMQGAAFAPEATRRVTLTQYPGATPDDVADRLLAGAFLAEEVGYIYRADLGGATSVPLMNFRGSNSAQPPDKAFTGESGVWVLALGADAGVLPVALLTLVPTSDSAVSGTATMAPQSGALELTGSFLGAEAAHTQPLPTAIEWGKVTVTTQGGSFATWSPDTVLIDHFETPWPEDVEDALAHATAIPTARWSAPTGGWAALQDLTALKGETGDFPGFDDSGTWIVSLVCAACPLPLPLYAGLVEADAP